MTPPRTSRRRERAWYLPAALVFATGMAGTTLPTPLYGLYQQRIGFSELVVTAVFAVYAVGVIAALLLAGTWSDRVGRRPILFAALGLSAASAGCFLAQDGLPLLFTGRVLSGLSAGLLSGAATAAVLELAPRGRERQAGFAATAANMGGLGCGPLLSGALAEWAPEPLRLPFAIHLALVLVAAGVVGLLPETVTGSAADSGAGSSAGSGSGSGSGAGAGSGASARGASGSRSRFRPAGMRVPQAVRGVFVPAGLAAFAGFSVLGLFTAVSPSFLAQELEVTSTAVAGVVAFSVFAASTAGQLVQGGVPARHALPLGCAVLVVGLGLIAGALLLASLALLLGGAVVAGTGQGLAFRAGLTAVGRRAPQDQRGGAISAYFVVAYLGISLPVVGVGGLVGLVGLRDAGLVFTGCVAAVAVVVGAWLVRRPLPRSTE